MVRKEIESKVAEVVCDELGLQTCEMTDNLKEDLGADSLDEVEIWIGCEKAFDIYIDYNALRDLKFITVGDIADYIEKML